MLNPGVKNVNSPKQFEVRPQIIYVEAPFQPPGVHPKYHSKQAIVLAACQTCIGILCIIFSIQAIIAQAFWASFGSGFFAGTFFILTGIIGMLSVRCQTRCMIIAHLVYSIISICVAMMFFGVGVTAWAADAFDCQDSYDLYHCLYLKPGTRITISGFMVLMAMIDTALATWSAVICCQAVCREPKSLQGNVIQMTQSGVQDDNTGQQTPTNNMDNPQVLGKLERKEQQVLRHQAKAVDEKTTAGRSDQAVPRCDI